MTLPLLRIGTRGSPLALAQANEVRRRLGEAFAELSAPGALETVIIKTSGDTFLDRTLADIGGKGLFTKEIDEALLEGRIDLAVHSMKDLPTWIPEGIVLASVLPREDPRDAFIGQPGSTLDSLPPGSVVGTASLRRMALVLHHRPDLQVVPLRGNVQTRLAKVADGVVDATLLAMAGLNRLGMADAATAAIETDQMLPAVAQGAIGLTCRPDDDRVMAYLTALDHAATNMSVTAERAMLEALDGSCRTPIAALARLDGRGGLALDGLVARPNGTEVVRTSRAGHADDARSLGWDAGMELRQHVGPGFFDESS